MNGTKFVLRLLFEQAPFTVTKHLVICVQMASQLKIRSLFHATVVVLAGFFMLLIILNMLAPASVEMAVAPNRNQPLNMRPRAAPLVVLVLSSPGNKDRRDAIRNTWMKFGPHDKIAKFFAIGTRRASNSTTLEMEELVNGDLIQLSDLEDSYQTLTSKVLSSFRWITQNVNFSYVLKVDDDSFARTDVIFEELEHRPTVPPLYWGFFDGRAHVKHKGRWAEHKWILCDRYLPHARGGGYVLSASLVKHLVDSMNLLQMFNSEDISVGTWLAPLEIERLHDPRFDTEHVSRGCSNSYIVTHKQDVRAMFFKYSNIMETGLLCGHDGEFRTRQSYNYNWSVLPSQCCIRTDSSIP